jgi:membrane fusion protein (multidrug efflux system)
MRRLWWINGGAMVAVAAVATLVVMRIQASDAETARKKEVAANVTLEFTAAEVVSPQIDRMPRWIEFSGPLVAPATAVVRSRAQGTLLSLQVAEGSRVKAGQVLGQVDLAELSSRVAERDAALDSARAQLTRAEQQHQANRRLAGQDFISPSALEASATALESARAQLAAAQAQLSSSRVNLRDAALVAPIGGVVARRHVVPGEKLSTEQNVLTIVDLSRLELAGNVGTHEVSLLQPGMSAQVQVDGFSKPVVGRLGRIAPAAEPGTRSISVVIEMANADELFRAGQYALARVQLKDAVDRLTVPLTAVAQDAGQQHLWLIEDGVLVRRTVTTGRRDDARGRVEVLDGLTAAAKVLAVRFDNLKEGTKASLLPPRASVASAPASRNSP